MANDIIELTPEFDSRFKSPAEAYAFANQYAAMLAERAIQNHAPQMPRGRSHGLPGWIAIAAASGAAVASAVVYFLSY